METSKNAFEDTGIEHQKKGISKKAWKFRNRKKRSGKVEKAVKHSVQWGPKHNSGSLATESGHIASLIAWV